MKVLAVAAEVFPLVKTGGLADVVGRGRALSWRYFVRNITENRL